MSVARDLARKPVGMVNHAPRRRAPASSSKRAPMPCSASLLRMRLRVTVKRSRGRRETLFDMDAAIASAAEMRRCSGSPWKNVEWGIGDVLVEVSRAKLVLGLVDVDTAAGGGCVRATG